MQKCSHVYLGGKYEIYKYGGALTLALKCARRYMYLYLYIYVCLYLYI